MTYTETFGGTTIYPSDVTYLALALTADATLQWPLNASTSENVVARIIDVTSTGAYSIIMPPADETGPGQTIEFVNLSAYTITVKNSIGGTILSLATGTSWQLYLTDNSTAAGSWRSLQYGSTVSQAQASALAGYGLVATGSMLSQSMPVTELNSNFALGATSRAGVYNWTGGLGTITLPSAVTVANNWFAIVRNSGTGNLTVDPTGSETINDASSLVLLPGDSAIVTSDGANFITVGLGQATTFTFDYTSIDLTGLSGNYTLSGSELNRISYTFVGALAGNIEIVVPSTTQQYWVSNDTTGGSYTLGVRTSTQSPAIPVARGSAAILKCDGSDVARAETASIATPIAVADGGTGSTTAGGALINLGGTATGIAVFTAADAAAARVAIGAGTGTVTSVGMSGGTTGLTTTGGPVTGSGTFTLGGTLVVASGGTGATSLTGLVVGNGTSAMTTVAAPSGTVVGTTDTQTLTNKRVTERSVSAGATSGTLTPNSDTTDIYVATGLTGSTTFAIPSGTPTNGQKLMIRIKDNGTIRTLAWTTTAGGYRVIGTVLPTTTVANKTMYVGCIYNSTDSFWDVVAVASET